MDLRAALLVERRAAYGRLRARGLPHSVVRAVVSPILWSSLPEARLTLLPLAVAGIYLVTVAAILVDSGRMARRPAAAV